MNIVHLLIGIVLIIIGLVTTGFIFYYFISKRDKSQYMFLSLSESLATLVLGALFISCHVNLRQLNSLDALVQNGTNNEQEYFDLEANPTVINETVDFEMKDIFNDERFYPIGEAEVVLEDQESVSIEAHPETAVDNFLKNYQALIKDMLNKRNASNETRSVYYNNKLLVKQGPYRISKQFLFEDNTNKTISQEANDTFYKECILFYSFAYCIVSLIVGTIQCSYCKKILEKPAQDPDNITTVKSTKQADKEIETTTPPTADKQAEPNINPLQIFVMIGSKWLFPIICVLVLYALMTEQSSSKPILPSNPNEPTHDDMMDAIRTHVNISTPESKDLNNIIGQIYEIVSKASANHSATANFTYPPIMYEIVDYFNNKNRQNRQLLSPDSMRNNREYQPPLAVKIETFVLFVVAYFGTIYYAKIRQLQLEPENTKRGTLRTRINSFSGLWLPAALETCVRMYFVYAEPSLISDLLLGIGNINRIVSNIINVHQIRSYVRSTNAILPAT